MFPPVSPIGWELDMRLIYWTRLLKMCHFSLFVFVFVFFVSKWLPSFFQLHFFSVIFFSYFVDVFFPSIFAVTTTPSNSSVSTVSSSGNHGAQQHHQHHPSNNNNVAAAVAAAAAAAAAYPNSQHGASILSHATSLHTPPTLNPAALTGVGLIAADASTGAFFYV